MRKRKTTVSHKTSDVNNLKENTTQFGHVILK